MEKPRSPLLVSPGLSLGQGLLHEEVQKWPDGLIHDQRRSADAVSQEAEDKGCDQGSFGPPDQRTTCVDAGEFFLSDRNWAILMEETTTAA